MRPWGREIGEWAKRARAGKRASVGVSGAKRWACQEWDSNPRLQGRLRPERSALDRSAILTAGLGAWPLPWLGPGADARYRSSACVRKRRRASQVSLCRSLRRAGRHALLPSSPPPRAALASPRVFPSSRRGGSMPASEAAGRAHRVGWVAAGCSSRSGSGPGRLASPLSRVLCCVSVCPARARCLRWAGGRGRAGPGVPGLGTADWRPEGGAGVAVLVSIVVSIPACHAGDRGSIPRRGGSRPFWPPARGLRPSLSPSRGVPFFLPPPTASWYLACHVVAPDERPGQARPGPRHPRSPCGNGLREAGRGRKAWEATE